MAQWLSLNQGIGSNCKQLHFCHLLLTILSAHLTGTELITFGSKRGTKVATSLNTGLCGYTT